MGRRISESKYWVLMGFVHFTERQTLPVNSLNGVELKISLVGGLHYFEFDKNLSIRKKPNGKL